MIHFLSSSFSRQIFGPAILGATGPPGPIKYNIKKIESSNDCTHFLVKVLTEFDHDYYFLSFAKCEKIRLYFKENQIIESIQEILFGVKCTIDDLIYLAQYSLVLKSNQILKMIWKYIDSNSVDIFIDNMLVYAVATFCIDIVLFLSDKKKNLNNEHKTHSVRGVLLKLNSHNVSLKDFIVSYSSIATIIVMHNIYFSYSMDSELSMYLGRMVGSTNKMDCDLFSQICYPHLKVLVAIALDSYSLNRIKPNLISDVMWTNDLNDLVNPLYLINKFMKKRDWKKIQMMYELGRVYSLEDVFVNHVMYNYFNLRLYEIETDLDVQ
jgi:hypothetical protein